MLPSFLRTPRVNMPVSIAIFSRRGRVVYVWGRLQIWHPTLRTRTIQEAKPVRLFQCRDAFRTLDTITTPQHSTQGSVCDSISATRTICRKCYCVDDDRTLFHDLDSSWIERDAEISQEGFIDPRDYRKRKASTALLLPTISWLRINHGKLPVLSSVRTKELSFLYA